MLLIRLLSGISVQQVARPALSTAQKAVLVQQLPPGVAQVSVRTADVLRAVTTSGTGGLGSSAPAATIGTAAKASTGAGLFLKKNTPVARFGIPSKSQPPAKQPPLLPPPSHPHDSTHAHISEPTPISSVPLPVFDSLLAASPETHRNEQQELITLLTLAWKVLLNTNCCPRDVAGNKEMEGSYTSHRHRTVLTYLHMLCAVTVLGAESPQSAVRALLAWAEGHVGALSASSSAPAAAVDTLNLVLLLGKSSEAFNAAQVAVRAILSSLPVEHTTAILPPQLPQQVIDLTNKSDKSETDTLSSARAQSHGKSGSSANIAKTVVSASVKLHAYQLVAVFLDALPVPTALYASLATAAGNDPLSHTGYTASFSPAKCIDSYLFCLRTLLNHDKFRQAMLCPLHGNARTPVHERLHHLMIHMIQFATFPLHLQLIPCIDAWLEKATYMQEPLFLQSLQEHAHCIARCPLGDPNNTLNTVTSIFANVTAVAPIAASVGPATNVVQGIGGLPLLPHEAMHLSAALCDTMELNAFYTSLGPCPCRQTIHTSDGIPAKGDPPSSATSVRSLRCPRLVASQWVERVTESVCYCHFIGSSPSTPASIPTLSQEEHRTANNHVATAVVTVYAALRWWEAAHRALRRTTRNNATNSSTGTSSGTTSHSAIGSSNAAALAIPFISNLRDLPVRAAAQVLLAVASVGDSYATASTGASTERTLLRSILNMACQAMGEFPVATGSLASSVSHIAPSHVAPVSPRRTPPLHVIYSGIDEIVRWLQGDETSQVSAAANTADTILQEFETARGTCAGTGSAVELAITNYLFAASSILTHTKQIFISSYHVLVQEPFLLFRLTLPLLAEPLILGLVTSILASLLNASRAELAARLGGDSPPPNKPPSQPCQPGYTAGRHRLELLPYISYTAYIDIQELIVARILLHLAIEGDHLLSIQSTTNTSFHTNRRLFTRQVLRTALERLVSQSQGGTDTFTTSTNIPCNTNVNTNSLLQALLGHDGLTAEASFALLMLCDHSTCQGNGTTGSTAASKGRDATILQTQMPITKLNTFMSLSLGNAIYQSIVQVDLQSLDTANFTRILRHIKMFLSIVAQNEKTHQIFNKTNGNSREQSPVADTPDGALKVSYICQSILSKVPAYLSLCLSNEFIISNYHTPSEHLAPIIDNVKHIFDIIVDHYHESYVLTLLGMQCLKVHLYAPPGHAAHTVYATSGVFNRRDDFRDKIGMRRLREGVNPYVYLVAEHGMGDTANDSKLQHTNPISSQQEHRAKYVHSLIERIRAQALEQQQKNLLNKAMPNPYAVSGASGKRKGTHATDGSADASNSNKRSRGIDLKKDKEQEKERRALEKQQLKMNKQAALDQARQARLASKGVSKNHQRRAEREARAELRRQHRELQSLKEQKLYFSDAASEFQFLSGPTMSLTDLLSGNTIAQQLRKHQSSLYSSGSGDTDSEASAASGMSVSGRGRVRKVSQRYGDYDTSVEFAFGDNGAVGGWDGDEEDRRYRAKRTARTQKTASQASGSYGTSSGQDNWGQEMNMPSAFTSLPVVEAQQPADSTDMNPMDDSASDSASDNDDGDDNDDDQLTLEGTDSSSDYASEVELVEQET